LGGPHLHECNECWWGVLSAKRFSSSRTSRTARTPLKEDVFAEYRDWDYFKVLGSEQLQDQLKHFWPNGGHSARRETNIIL